MNETRDKLLETAERLFAEQGFAATSLRQIISEAGVNLAAIHYHFGSKQELLDELILRKARPVNEERLARLDRVEAEARGGPPDLRKVLEAFLLPICGPADRNPQFVRLMGRIYAERLLLPVVERHFQPVLGRFLPMMRRAIPGVSDNEFEWRMHFLIGAMAHTMCGPPDFTRIGETAGGFQNRIEHLIAFAVGGFHAPAPAVPDANAIEVHS